MHSDAPLRRPAGLALTLALALLVGAPSARAFEVIADGKRQQHQLLAQAAKPWRICALLPQGKDKYWWSVSWALADEAKRQGVQLGIYQANSYADLALQKRQWADCVALGAQAFIVAAISADGLNAEIAQARADKRPVIDLINGVDAETSSHAGVSFADMSRLTIAYLLSHTDKPRPRIAWFPGPADAAWVRSGERGLQEALAGQTVELRHGGYGPTDAASQATLVRRHLEQAGPPDFIVGNALAIEFAARWLAQRRGPRPQLLSYYATEDLVPRIERGEVLAAPTDQPILQARLGLDLAVRALQGQVLPRHVSPAILMLDRASLPRVDLSNLLPPKGQWLVLQPLPPP